MATKHPIRMLLSIIDDEDLISKYVDYFKYGDTEIKNIYRQLEAGINVGLTTEYPEESWTLFQQLWKYATPEHMKENVQ